MKRFVIMLGTLGLILASCAVESNNTADWFIAIIILTPGAWQ